MRKNSKNFKSHDYPNISNPCFAQTVHKNTVFDIGKILRFLCKDNQTKKDSTAFRLQRENRATLF